MGLTIRSELLTPRLLPAQQGILAVALLRCARTEFRKVCDPAE